MRFVRAAVIIIFILSLGIFGVSQAVELQNRDPHAPEITSDREVLEVPCEYTREQLVEGLTATDQEDGDLTSQIVAGSFSRFIEPGLCNLTYVVFDSADQPGSLTRQVKFTDYHSPRFTLAEPLVFAEGEGSYNEVMNRLEATDQLDGSLSDWITQTETDVNYQTAGTYTITFEVANSFGDSVSRALPVHVTGPGQDSLDIVLTGGIAYIEKGGTLNAGEYIEELRDNQGNSLDTSIIQSDSNVDPNTPGVYEIHYTADDGAGNTGQTWMTVIVEE